MSSVWRNAFPTQSTVTVQPASQTPPPAAGVDQTLYLIARNQNRKLAKTIGMSCLEFVLAIFAIVQGVGQDGLSISGAALFAAIAVSVYAIFLMCCIGCHSCCSPTVITNSDTEAAYQQTNMVPYCDVLMEIPISCSRGNPCIVLLLWAIFLLIIIMLILLLKNVFTPGATVTEGAIIGCVLAVLQLYRIHGDIFEYLVRSSPKNGRVVGGQTFF
jgi:hypothetical protein